MANWKAKIQIPPQHLEPKVGTFWCHVFGEVIGGHVYLRIDDDLGAKIKNHPEFVKQENFYSVDENGLVVHTSRTSLKNGDVRCLEYHEVSGVEFY